MVDLLLDALLDTLKTLPFLFGAYLLMEYLEHRAGDKLTAALSRLGPWGPLGGALLGCVPQCGFSVAAANFYAGRLITPRTGRTTVLLGEDLQRPLPGLCFMSKRYLAGGGLTGAIALLGPTRMPFEQLVPVLDYFALKLGECMAGKAQEDPQ